MMRFAASLDEYFVIGNDGRSVVENKNEGSLIDHFN